MFFIIDKLCFDGLNIIIPIDPFDFNFHQF